MLGGTRTRDRQRSDGDSQRVRNATNKLRSAAGLAAITDRRRRRGNEFTIAGRRRCAFPVSASGLNANPRTAGILPMIGIGSGGGGDAHTQTSRTHGRSHALAKMCAVTRRGANVTDDSGSNDGKTGLCTIRRRRRRPARRRRQRPRITTLSTDRWRASDGGRPGNTERRTANAGW